MTRKLTTWFGTGVIAAALVALIGAALLIAVAAPAPLAVYAQDGGDDGDDDHGEDDPGEHGGADESDLAARRGAALYATYCQVCHGPQGESRGEHPAYAAVEYDGGTDDQAAARAAIENGVEPDTDADAETGTDAASGTMPAYGDLLDETAINDLLAYMDTWGTGSTPPLPTPNLDLDAIPDYVPDYFGDARAGAVVYATSCYGCHGANGEGRPGDQFPAIEIDDATLRTLATGHAPPLAESAGGPLSEEQVTDLVTYLAAWEMEPEAGEPDASSAGVGAVIVILGILSIFGVGIAFLARNTSEGENGSA